eukprot:Nk52_evm5s355 gene=Nk52_evmTU5s355
MHHVDGDRGGAEAQEELDDNNMIDSYSIDQLQKMFPRFDRYELIGIHSTNGADYNRAVEVLISLESGGRSVNHHRHSGASVDPGAGEVYSVVYEDEDPQKTGCGRPKVTVSRFVNISLDNTNPVRDKKKKKKIPLKFKDIPDRFLRISAPVCRENGFGSLEPVRDPFEYSCVATKTLKGMPGTAKGKTKSGEAGGEGGVRGVWSWWWKTMGKERKREDDAQMKMNPPSAPLSDQNCNSHGDIVMGQHQLDSLASGYNPQQQYNMQLHPIGNGSSASSSCSLASATACSQPPSSSSGSSSSSSSAKGGDKASGDFGADGNGEQVPARLHGSKRARARAAMEAYRSKAKRKIQELAKQWGIKTSSSIDESKGNSNHDNDNASNNNTHRSKGENNDDDDDVHLILSKVGINENENVELFGIADDDDDDRDTAMLEMRHAMLKMKLQGNETETTVAKNKEGEDGCDGKGQKQLAVVNSDRVIGAGNTQKGFEMDDDDDDDEMLDLRHHL